VQCAAARDIGSSEMRKRVAKPSEGSRRYPHVTLSGVVVQETPLAAMESEAATDITQLATVSSPAAPRAAAPLVIEHASSG